MTYINVFFKVNQQPFYERRSALPVHLPRCVVLDKVECDLYQYLSGEEKYSQLFECVGRNCDVGSLLSQCRRAADPGKEVFPRARCDLAPKRPALLRRVFLIEFGKKPPQRGVLVAALPGCDDLFLLPFSHKRDKDKVIGVVEPVGAIIGQKGNALFR